LNSSSSHPYIDLLRDAFDDSDLPFPVDLVEWAGTSEEFRKVIAATAKVLGGTI
jgi:hypothetical protein